jgi:hypothetical protein
VLTARRPSKFPEIEREMARWLQDLHATGKPSLSLSDQKIRQRAKDIARAQGIADDKFKASSGWVENFKHRHHIRRGVWYGLAQATAPAADMDNAMDEDDDEDKPGPSHHAAAFFDHAPSYPPHLLYPAPLEPSTSEGAEQYPPPAWKEEHSPVPSPAGSPTAPAPEFVHPPSFQHAPETTPTASQSQAPPPPAPAPFPTPAPEPRHAAHRRELSQLEELPALPAEFAQHAFHSQHGLVHVGLPPSASYAYAPPRFPTPPATELKPEPVPPALALDGTVTPMPGGLSDARKSLVALLEFFETQPPGSVITGQDRDALAAIASKLAQ